MILFLLTVYSFSIFGCKEYSESDFGIGDPVMSMYRVFLCVVGRECLLWPVSTLDKTLLAFACIILYIKAKFACYSTYLFLLFFLTSYFCIPVPYNEKYIFWGVLVPESLLGLHRSIQIQLLQHYWLGHRLRLLWYWMSCLGNKQWSFCHFWDCTQELYFGLLFTMTATPFLLRDPYPQQ